MLLAVPPLVHQTPSSLQLHQTPSSLQLHQTPSSLQLQICLQIHWPCLQLQLILMKIQVICLTRPHRNLFLFSVRCVPPAPHLSLWPPSSQPSSQLYCAQPSLCPCRLFSESPAKRNSHLIMANSMMGQEL